MIEPSVVALSSRTATPSLGRTRSIEERVYLVRDYAKQETVGPLKGAGKWIGYGVADRAAPRRRSDPRAARLLRLIQTEWDRAASGSLSWFAYLIVLVVCIAAHRHHGQSDQQAEPQQGGTRDGQGRLRAPERIDHAKDLERRFSAFQGDLKGKVADRNGR